MCPDHARVSGRSRVHRQGRGQELSGRGPLRRPVPVVRWATDALDEVRRQAWNDARRLARATEATRGRGRPAKNSAPRPAGALARCLKGVRYALWKNPENLTEKQRVKLDWIARTDPRLHRAYQLKEALRLIFQLPFEQAAEALARWVSWARRCRIPAFVKLQKRIVAHSRSILAAIEHGLSNGRTESVNTKIRLITRIAFGFKSPMPSSRWPCSASAVIRPSYPSEMTHGSSR